MILTLVVIAAAVATYYAIKKGVTAAQVKSEVAVIEAAAIKDASLVMTKVKAAVAKL